MRVTNPAETKLAEEPGKVERKRWATPVVIVESAHNAGAKGADSGDYSSGGNPYGS